MTGGVFTPLAWLLAMDIRKARGKWHYARAILTGSVGPNLYKS
jgi:hypothetical protein